jgi:hypothetical protein
MITKTLMQINGYVEMQQQRTLNLCVITQKTELPFDEIRKRVDENEYG